jgi:cation:H+ antiporter
VIYAQLVAGFIYLLGGGDLLVRGAVALARRLRVPSVFVALVIVGLGTSLPELVVSVNAAASGFPGLALGNVVGSNIANVLVVAGFAAIVFPLRTGDRAARRSCSMTVVVSVLLTALCLVGRDLTRWEGVLLLGILVGGFTLTLRSVLRAQERVAVTTPIDWVLGLPSKLPMILFFIVTGLLVLPLGADLLVEAAVILAARFGVPETVVGLSVVAVGTSLPEVATTIIASRQRRAGMVVGTVAGSNLFNILGILGASALVSATPMPVSERFISLDLPVMVISAVALASFTWLRRPISARMGLALVAAYLAYLGVLYAAV